jgi:ApbE superfamily uncharacterized protein (UPF0280 family)
VSGNQFAGTMANFSMSQSSGWVGSSVGRGVAFDATDDALTIAHNAAIANALTSSTFTFAVISAMRKPQPVEPALSVT